jgi:hypothetical protein
VSGTCRALVGALRHRLRHAVHRQAPMCSIQGAGLLRRAPHSRVCRATPIMCSAISLIPATTPSDHENHSRVVYAFTRALEEFATLCGAGRVWRHADLPALPEAERHP